MKHTDDLHKLTDLIRYDILTSTTTAGSGHPSSSLSAVELMATVLFDGYFHYDFDHQHYIYNDRLIFSKGHASPLLYSLYQAAGLVSYEELMTLRKFDSDLEGHPTPNLKYIDVATGSLGQGLSAGLGMALAIKYHVRMQEHKPKREPMVWVLMGDSEIAEGQVWEAAQVASHYKVDNLVGILDVNRLGQRGETMVGWDVTTYEKRFASFGWHTVVIENGNNLEEVQEAFKKTFVKSYGKPIMIIAKTKKGAGVPLIEDKDGWHGKPLTPDMLKEALKDFPDVDTDLIGTVNKPEKLEIKWFDQPAAFMPTYGEKMATREAYGEGLNAIAFNPYVVVLDAETSNSTFSDKFKKEHPERFFEMYIAEQNMVSVAVGMSKVGLTPFVSSFAAFFTRSFDQIRMAQYSVANIKVVGSHAGVSIGSDGSSQMALEDLAMMRSILDGVVLYPSDAVSTVELVKEMDEHKGVSYMRLTREKTSILYKESEKFPIGGSKILKESLEDKAVIIGAGITVHESLKAYNELQAKGISVAVLDAYSIKPLDSKTILKLARQTGHVIVVEDHYPDGGLGDAVAKVLTENKLAVRFTHLCVHHIPHSGEPSELLAWEKIDAKAICDVVAKQ